MTPGTGGTGLNGPQASIMFQMSMWWNRNLELQMAGSMIQVAVSLLLSVRIERRGLWVGMGGGEERCAVVRIREGDRAAPEGHWGSPGAAKAI